MKYDAFSQYYSRTNFVFFLGAICFSVVIQHLLYIAISCTGVALYYLLLNGRRGWMMILGMIPVFVVLSALNPLFNHYGERTLFHIFGEPYTREALYYGMATAGIFVSMMLCFGCLIPAFSLLLVMVLRMIPSLMREAGQITGARKSIGKGVGEQCALREKVADGMNILSALTDWTLEGSIVTADSMRARGYGAAKRTSFQIYHITARDFALLTWMLVLTVWIVIAGGTEATFTPVLYIAPPPRASLHSACFF